MADIAGVSQQRILELTKAALSTLGTTVTLNQNVLGALTIRKMSNGFVLSIIRIQPKTHIFPTTILHSSLIKGEFLRTQPAHILSSGQINNVNAGAIKAVDVQLILSFAGLGEKNADETIALAVAVQLKWITYEQAQLIARLSNNEFFKKLMKQLN